MIKSIAVVASVVSNPENFMFVVDEFKTLNLIVYNVQTSGIVETVNITVPAIDT